jgi:hypothetical protein
MRISGHLRPSIQPILTLLALFISSWAYITGFSKGNSAYFHTIRIGEYFPVRPPGKGSDTFSSYASPSNGCPSGDVQEPLDPFRDLVFTPLQTDEYSDTSYPHYSSYHCVGTGTRDPEFQHEVDSLQARRPSYVSRSCWYRNLYYRLEDQSFHYLASPTESHFWQKAREAGDKSFVDFHSRMNVTLGHISDTFERKQLERFHATPWRPIMHFNIQQPPMTNNNTNETRIFRVSGPSQRELYFSLYHPFHSMNFGHFLWDDLLSVFSLLDLFGLGQDTNVQALPFVVELPNQKSKQNFGGNDNQWRCSPANHLKWTNCVKLYKRVYAPLTGVQPDICTDDLARTGNWLRGTQDIGVWPKHPKDTDCEAKQNRTNLPPTDSTEYMLLPHVLAGTGRLGFFGCEEDCSLGRGPQFYRFRNYLLQHLLGLHRACTINQDPPRGYITFSLSIDSSRPDQVYNFTREIQDIRAKYGDKVVNVVDMSTMSVAEQATLAANSAVFLSNHGGVGAPSIFLPQGAAAIIFWHGRGRLEANFYESAGYFRTNWVSVEERPFVNRTLALIDQEVAKTALRWPSILAAQGLQSEDH